MAIESVKKDNVIVSRLNDTEYNKLEKIVKKTSQKKSAIIRKALNTYIYLNSGEIPIILWGRNEFAFSLSSMSDSKIKELADLSYNNAKINIKHWVRGPKYQIDFSDESIALSKVPIQFLLRSLIYSLSKGHLNWFDSIEFSWIERPKKKLRIIGNHICNENFSKYMKYILENYLSPYGYIVIKEALFEDLIILEFSKEKNPDNEKE